MAVTGTLISISYNTDGVATQFAYPDYLFQFSDLQVIYTTFGASTSLVLNSDYSLSGVVDTFGAYPSGVTLTTLGLGLLQNPLPPGTLFISRYTQRTQQIQYIDGDNFPAMKHEHALDKLTLMIQEISANFLGFTAGTPPLIGSIGQFYLNYPPIPGGMLGWVMTTLGWREFANISLL